MTDKLIEQLSIIAEEMNALKKSDSAQVKYDLFADAIYWSDEILDSDKKTKKWEFYWSLRPVLRYRTTLIINSPEIEYLEYWAEANKLFPNWPGFSEERLQPNEGLKMFLDTESIEASKEMDKLWDDHESE